MLWHAWPGVHAQVGVVWVPPVSAVRHVTSGSGSRNYDVIKKQRKRGVY